MNDEIYNKMYSLLIEYKIATEAEIQLVGDIVGFNRDTLDMICYTRTGEHIWQKLEN